MVLDVASTTVVLESPVVADERADEPLHTGVSTMAATSTTAIASVAVVRLLSTPGRARRSAMHRRLPAVDGTP